jgi:hypothetical protein
LANHSIGNAKQVFGFRQDSNNYLSPKMGFTRRMVAGVEKVIEIVMARLAILA